MNKTDQFQMLIDSAENIVFFGGAGVSCESGIPDFRSSDGLYNQQYKYSPETMLSHSFFTEHTEEFFEFYRDKMIYSEAEPNTAHKKLAELEEKGKLLAVITQNIDGLHQMAGSKNVIELHGSVHRNYCLNCHTEYPADYILNSKYTVPECVVCHGLVKPDVVLYEEPLEQNCILQAIYAISHADLLIIGGTSLTVYPAAGLIDYYYGSDIVVINKNSNNECRGTLVISEPIGSVFEKIKINKEQLNAKI